MSKIHIDLQNAVEAESAPDEAECRTLVSEVLSMLKDEQPAELTIRIVDEAESAELNEEYRGKKGPTNVLSFPFEAPVELPVRLLGDLVICASKVESEAVDQHKSIKAHWSHLIVHGTLHLLGYDHQSDEQAEAMESLERNILHNLGFPDPYQTIDP